MWFYALLGVVVVGLLIAAFLDRKAKKVRGELKPSTLDPEGHVSRIEPGYMRPEVPLVVPHSDS
ncbi:hypothetical protein NLX83_02590 [Allokutzneria sp. A3M-2-11 16]|uniref:hypothetical protein n=1 Tax=Allokutzneria sp. A3M-2-11 16 TaxID=2962043 RepID=UPI0020B860C5|nr:hypothetical protein [Allokutzneria sp. A3M-2-11 16]MCP3798136.1 hypothetical protein [Allokutzneria sp. A3M-2-11 16]